jgi:hypothetical protein
MINSSLLLTHFDRRKLNRLLLLLLLFAGLLSGLSFSLQVRILSLASCQFF